MVHGLRVPAITATRTGNNTVETGSNGRRVDTIEPASYLAARWRRSSANWFPMLPPLPRDKTGLVSLAPPFFSSAPSLAVSYASFLPGLSYTLVTYVRSSHRYSEPAQTRLTAIYDTVLMWRYLIPNIHFQFFKYKITFLSSRFCRDTTLIRNRRDESLHFEWLKFKVKGRATTTRAILISSRANLHAHALRG